MKELGIFSNLRKSEHEGVWDIADYVSKLEFQFSRLDYTDLRSEVSMIATSLRFSLGNRNRNKNAAMISSGQTLDKELVAWQHVSMMCVEEY